MARGAEVSQTIYFDLETGGVEPRHPNIQLAAIAIDDKTGLELSGYPRQGEAMPIYHRVEQRSPEWFALRIGKPTASEFHKIITPKTGQLSAQSTDYAHSILAELMLGKPLESPETEWMVRGQELEDNAVEAYEFEMAFETTLGGFITDDAATMGCSPDRLVGDDGLVEMKCPAPNTHIGYLLDRTSLEMGKRVQVQGQLLVTGRKWCDLVAYHPELPLVVVRVKRDEPFIEKMRVALNDFVKQLAAMREKLEREFGPFKPITFNKPAAVDDSLGVSDEDATRVWEASQSASQ